MSENTPSPDSPRRWLPEFFELRRRRLRSQGRVLAASCIVGVVAGLGGIAFTIAGQFVLQNTLQGIAGVPPAGPAGELEFPWLPRFFANELQPWLLLVVPTIGGLVSGFLVFRFAPEAEGHGTDAAIAAYHSGAALIRPRVPLIKLVASAITIGTGGSGGREGPIAQIGAGFGSLFARLLHFTATERRILLIAGMGAGIAAVFRAPLAGTLFAAEVLYFSTEFEPEVILPTGLASVVAYCTFGTLAQLLGGTLDAWQPIFEIADVLDFTSVWELGPYTLLALWVAFLAMIYVRTFYGITHLFHRLPMPRMLKPAVGALLTGLIGIGLYYGSGQNNSAFAVLAYGYGSLQDGLSRDFAMSAGMLLLVAVGKLLTTSLTIGSGGSGGVFGPSLVIGGCAGGALGISLHHLWPTLVPYPGTFVIIGMAGFFAAAAKTPFSTLIIVSEMTGDYRLLMPTLWVCLIAFLISDEYSLYQSQVESRSQSPAHQGEFFREIFAGQSIGRFLKPLIDFPVLHPSDSLASVCERFDLSAYPALPVVDGDNHLQGMIALDEVERAERERASSDWLLAADLMRPLPRPLFVDDGLEEAIELFAKSDLAALPVVDGPVQRKVIGLVRRAEVSQVYIRQVRGDRPTAD
jgi:CIC family chloride channel protein